jgi:hypothetical protein
MSYLMFIVDGRNRAKFRCNLVVVIVNISLIRICINHGQKVWGSKPPSEAGWQQLIVEATFHAFSAPPDRQRIDLSTVPR